MGAMTERSDRSVDCRCRDVRVALQATVILDGISFEVRQGEFVSIMGRSGSGKTTLLRVLGGLLPPESGSVVVRGEAVDGPPEGVVMVFQNYGASLMPWRTVERNVALGLEDKVSEGERRQRVTEALEMVGLRDHATAYPWQLSGGMQQRVQLARALAMRPAILLMDEPFGSLDALTKSVLEDELLRVYERTGATVVFVTHDVDEAVYLSDRVLVIGGDPARIQAEIHVDCDRPRDQLETKESEGFLKARHALHEALRGER